jgi:hypothetical protein
MITVKRSVFSTEADDTIRMTWIDDSYKNAFDIAHPGEPAAYLSNHFKGNHRIASDGLQGVIADDLPVGATVILLQQHQGVLVEVGRTISADGSYNFNDVGNKPTYAVAVKDGYNAGIVAGILPEL